jgi:hypothetical protein
MERVDVKPFAPASPRNSNSAADPSWMSNGSTRSIAGLWSSVQNFRLLLAAAKQAVDPSAHVTEIGLTAAR